MMHSCAQPEQPDPARHERLVAIAKHASHIADSIIPAIIAQYIDKSHIAKLQRLQPVFTAFADGRHLDSSSLHDMSQEIHNVKQYAIASQLAELDAILDAIHLASKQHDDAADLLVSETFTAEHRTPAQQARALAAIAH